LLKLIFLTVGLFIGPFVCMDGSLKLSYHSVAIVVEKMQYVSLTDFCLP